MFAKEIIKTKEMQKKSILFVCLGNICRSPSAEGIFKKIIAEKGFENSFVIDSAGLLSVHQGNMPDSRMRHHAAQRGYDLVHRSRPVNVDDFDRFDLIIGMDDSNIAGLEKIANSPEHKAKIHRMTEYLQKMDADHVPDPYYGGDQGFQNVIDLLEDACDGLLKSLI